MNYCLVFLLFFFFKSNCILFQFFSNEVVKIFLFILLFRDVNNNVFLYFKIFLNIFIDILFLCFIFSVLRIILIINFFIGFWMEFILLLLILLFCCRLCFSLGL